MGSAANIIDHKNQPAGRRGRSGQWLSGAAVAVIAAFGGLLPAGEARAAIVYSGVRSLLAPATYEGVYLNLVTGVAATTSGSSVWHINVYNESPKSYNATGGLAFLTTGGATGGAGTMANSRGYGAVATNLGVGTLIAGGAEFLYSAFGANAGPTAFLLNSSDNYVGLRFLNETTGQLNYGWLQLALPSTYTGARTIVGWAYENTGASILSGDTGLAAAVPEPGSLALVGAALAAGAGALRRRKSA